jgi:hypothetical protein
MHRSFAGRVYPDRHNNLCLCWNEAYAAVSRLFQLPHEDNIAKCWLLVHDRPAAD